MKIINSEVFGTLYDKLYERIEETGNLEGLGIDWNVRQGIWKMWKGGQKYESLLLLIAYHYTRTDTTLLQIGQEKYVIREKTSAPEILKFLSLPVNLYSGKGEVYKVSDKVDLTEYTRKYEELYLLFSGYKKIGGILGDKLGLKNSEISLFCRAWKEGRHEDAITEIIAYQGSRDKDLELETPAGTKIFPRRSSAFDIVSTVEGI